MLRSPLLALACTLTALTATAQSGRTMRLLAPVVLGGTAALAIVHPPALAGSPFAYAVCSPSFPGALPLVVPGFVNSVLRIDPATTWFAATGLFDASGQSPVLTIGVPNLPQLVGFSFDVQGADLDANGFLTLTDDDLELVVAAAPSSNPNMLPIAPGSFVMGSGSFLPQYPSLPAELPVHPVTITRPFWVGKYEVTQAEYQALMGSNPSFFQGPTYPGSGNRPVDRVSWQQAIDYCDALSVQEAAAGRLPSGYEYRLPTEAEWEFCARAGTTTEFHVGPSLGCVDANVFDAGGSGAHCVPNPAGAPFVLGQTTAVGGYPANAWGLHDVHGNVVEWTLDGAGLSPSYAPGAVSDPFVASGVFRIARGGNWDSQVVTARCAYRGLFFPTFPGSTNGFRVVCAPVL